jgi:hypothetical protein
MASEVDMEAVYRKMDLIDELKKELSANPKKYVPPWKCRAYPRLGLDYPCANSDSCSKKKCKGHLKGYVDLHNRMYCSKGCHRMGMRYDWIAQQFQERFYPADAEAEDCAFCKRRTVVDSAGLIQQEGQPRIVLCTPMCKCGLVVQRMIAAKQQVANQ